MGTSEVNLEKWFQEIKKLEKEVKVLKQEIKLQIKGTGKLFIK